MDQPFRTGLTSITPVFAVSDLDRALAHYESLGFEVHPYPGGDYGFADRDGVGIHLTPQPDYDPAVHASTAYLYVEDADALAEEWSRPGIGGTTGPVRTMEYRLREGSHVDPDNNVIRFGSPLRER